MGNTVETWLRYSIELLEILPFMVCEHMWLISLSRKNHANNDSNCEKMWFSPNFISVLRKEPISHILIYAMYANIVC